MSRADDGFFKKESDEVFYPGEYPVIFNAERLQQLKEAARANVRQRSRFCAHTGVADNVHEMFIVHARDAYVRPHKHLLKAESLYLIEGEADIILFDDSGARSRIIELGALPSGKAFYYRISCPVYHTLRINSDIVCFHEVIAGPLDRADTVFPPWAPDPGDVNAQKIFLGRIRQ